MNFNQPFFISTYTYNKRVGQLGERERDERVVKMPLNCYDEVAGINLRNRNDQYRVESMLVHISARYDLTKNYMDNEEIEGQPNNNGYKTYFVDNPECRRRGPQQVHHCRRTKSGCSVGLRRD